MVVWLSTNVLWRLDFLTDQHVNNNQFEKQLWLQIKNQHIIHMKSWCFEQQYRLSRLMKVTGYSIVLMINFRWLCFGIVYVIHAMCSIFASLFDAFF